MEQMPSNAPMQGSPLSGNEKTMAIASLVLGVINLCAWFLPICGIPMSIAGLVLGYLGMKDQTQKTLAMIGMVLCGIGLLAGCVNGAWGAYLGFTGQSNFNFGQ